MTAAMHARLVEKLKRIRSGTYMPGDFIIADAKDAEMGGGIAALGTKRGLLVEPSAPQQLPTTGRP